MEMPAHMRFVLAFRPAGLTMRVCGSTADLPWTENHPAYTAKPAAPNASCAVQQASPPLPS
jgi:hypothetical protein